MEKSNIIIGDTATESLLKGIQLASKAIRLSYGPKGCNAVIEQEFYPYHIVANDCETILQSIHTTDPYKKIGLDLIKELSTKAHNDSGDGRKTTCIIAEEIVRLSLERKLVGISFKNELDSLITLIEKNIDEQKRTITVDEVDKVATISSESSEIGIILRDIYKVIGKDGIIIPEPSTTYTTSTEYIDGVRFVDTGYLSPYMVYDDIAEKEGRKPHKAVYHNPIILVTKRRIEKDADLEGIMSMVLESGRPLVIFTDDMDSGVATRLVATHRAKVAKILVIKAPVIWKNYVFEDFAKITGSTIVEDSSGVTFKNLPLSVLGTCGTITVDKDETIVIGGADISDHILYLKSIDDTDSQRRLAWLTTKSCILKIGANNESEMSYRRLKCYDAIHASRSALHDGVVMGGGVVLANAGLSLPKTDAGLIVMDSLMEPLLQNMENMGLKGESTTNILKDGFGDDIIDSASIVKKSVRNAISLASTVLTSGIVIRFPDKTPDQIASEALKNKGLRF